MEDLWGKIWNVLVRYSWHWLIPFLCAGISWPFVHNAIIQQIIGLCIGIVFNTTFGGKRTIAFVQLTWLAGVFGYSGYLNLIGMKVLLSGWSGAFEGVLVLSELLGIGCLFLWTFRGIKAIFQPISKWYLGFLFPTGLVIYLGIAGFPKYLGAIGDTSGAGGTFVMLVLWSLLIGFCCVVYWCFLGIQETFALGIQGFLFSTLLRDVLHHIGSDKLPLHNIMHKNKE